MEQSDVERLVGELELGVDRLRSLYEQYFMGIEKLEPTVPRKDVDRRIHVLRKEQIRNTALRFRFQMILQRYNTYQSHWQRICREIENGTYKRHMMRAQRRFEGSRSSLPPPPPPPAAAATTGAAAPAPLGFPEPGASLPEGLAAELAELEKEFGAVTRVGAPARPAPGPAAPAAKAGPPPLPGGAPRVPPAPPSAPNARPPGVPPPMPPRAPVQAPQPGAARAPAPAPSAPRAPAASTPGRPAPAATAATPGPSLQQPKAAPRPGDPSLSDERVRALYSQYVDAKRRQNESTAAITYEGVAKSLRDSSAKLREKHGRSVDFEVAVKDGKAILKPVLK